MSAATQLPRRLLRRVVRRAARPALMGPGSVVQALEDRTAALEQNLAHESALIQDLVLVARRVDGFLSTEFPDLSARVLRDTTERERAAGLMLQAVEAVRSRLEDVEDAQAKAAERLEDAQAMAAERFTAIEDPVVRSLALPYAAAAPYRPMPVANGEALGFDDGGERREDLYVAFEEVFRGSEERIRELQLPYRDILGGREPVLDAGCGRGEMLDLLGEWGLQGAGVDADAAMVARCRAKGHDVTHADALDHLESLDDGSLGAIFTAQVIEHLPFDRLQGLLHLAVRKLRPDGLLVAETVNPHAPDALKGFWSDPTHQHPLFPEAMLTLARAAGFASGHVLAPNGTGDLDHDRLHEPVYALVARTPT